MISSSLMPVQLRQTTRSPSRASKANRLSFSILRIYDSPSLTGNPCKNCRLLLEYALKITTLSESADRLFTQLPAANLTVFASDEIWQHILSPVLSNFSRIHPQIVFRRTSARECDLAVVMVPASSAAPVPNAIAKIRMSICAASLEKTLNFDLLYLPSESFARTNTCALLRGLLTDISLV